MMDEELFLGTPSLYIDGPAVTRASEQTAWPNGRLIIARQGALCGFQIETDKQELRQIADA